MPRLLSTPGWIQVTEPLAERQKSAAFFISSSSIVRDVKPVELPTPSEDSTFLPSPASGVPAQTLSPVRPALLSPVSLVSGALVGATAARTIIPPQTGMAPRMLTAPRTPMSPDLNKPLPKIGPAVGPAIGRSAPADCAVLSGPSFASNVSSVYDFKAYSDGHISVYKQAGDGPLGEPSTST